MSANKVNFGLKNVYYAVKTAVNTYSTPVAIAGAVSLSLDAEGEANTFYADNSKYYISYGNNGYTGTLEVAKFPASMLKEVWGLTETATSKVLVESSNAEANDFALLFQIDGDADEELYVLYNVHASRPALAGETIGENKEPKTSSCSITCLPDENGKTLARTTDQTTTTVKSGWFTSVFTAST